MDLPSNSTRRTIRAYPPHPLGRKPRELRLEEVLQAALLEFAERGFTAARLEDIARRTRMTRAAIYLYFPNKEALFEAVVRRWIVPSVEALEAVAADAAPGAWPALERLIGAIHDALAGSEQRLIFRMVMAEGQRAPEVLRFYYDAVVARGSAALHMILERGAASGEFPEHARAAQVESVVAPCLMGALWKESFDRFSPLDLGQLRETHLAMLQAWVEID